MRALLDTHAFLWWIGDDPRLSGVARDIIASASNTLLLSAASAWEIAIKAAVGKLRLASPVTSFVTSHMKQNHFDPLDVTVAHALRVSSLPPHHRDPFDRILVAQAQSEDLRILTSDPLIGRYDVQTLW